MNSRRRVNSNVMRLLNSLIVVLVLAPLFVCGQSAGAGAVKFDEFKITSDFAIDDMKARLDGFYKDAVTKEPDSRAYVFIYRGRRGSSRYTVSNVRDYLMLRGLAANRLTVVYGGRRNVPMVELWVAPKGATAPRPTPPFSRGGQR